MKLRLPLLVLFLLTLLAASITNANALDKTPTGFYYPTGVVPSDSKCPINGGTWLGRDAANGGCYYDGQYHVGVDIMGTVTDPVYPIADGTITNISSTGWGTGNVAAVVKHKLAGGGEFLAVYGHIVTSKNVGDPVTGGVAFGQIGSWPDGDHLHFGIHPSLPIPATNWGKMPNSSWPDTNGLVDPIEYINSYGPFGITAYSLPDTGQTKCYLAVSPYAEIPCDGTGQDGAYSINPMSYIDNGDGTVTDNNTGLVWQKCSMGQNNDSSCSGTAAAYNWYQVSGTYDADLNSDTTNVCGALSLVGGGWRLPSKKELMSIVDYSIPYPGPTIQQTYFPNTVSSFHWSSTPLASTPCSQWAWGVFFAYGGVGDYGGNYKVRCVRGAQADTPQLTNNGNGTVTDNRTGLVWQKGEPGQMLWSEALSYCEGLSLGGRSDWRLPNVKELESLTVDSRYNPAINTAFFSSAQVSYYWSSTEDASDPLQAWGVYFGSGLVGHGVKFGNAYHVRCVCGGQKGAIELGTGLSGTVTDSANHPLPGATVTIGAQTATTDATGKYTISPLAPGTYPAMVSKDGYTSLSDTVVITSGVQSIKNFHLHPVSANDPVVTNITSQYSGFLYYLPGVDFPVTYTATVTWGSHSPGKVLFITPKKTYEVTFSGSQASQQINIGQDFDPCTTLKVVAVTDKGIMSAAKTADFIVTKPLASQSVLGGLGSLAAAGGGDSVSYKANLSLNSAFIAAGLGDGAINGDIPIFGGKGLSLNFLPELDFSFDAREGKGRGPIPCSGPTAIWPWNSRATGPGARSCTDSRI